jgi:hypothetical protein
MNTDLRRRATEKIGRDFFFVRLREGGLRSLHVNQGDDRLIVGIQLYNAISRHSRLTYHNSPRWKDENVIRPGTEIRLRRPFVY